MGYDSNRVVKGKTGPFTPDNIMGTDARSILDKHPDALDQLYMWFGGHYMSPNDIPQAAKDVFIAVGQTYGKPLPADGPLYRVVNDTCAEGACGPREFLSFSRDQAGAQWYWDTFCLGENKSGTCQFDWRIIKANPIPVCDFGQCLAFWKDCCKDFYDWLNIPDMLGQKETIALAHAACKSEDVLRFPKVTMTDKERFEALLSSLGIKAVY